MRHGAKPNGASLPDTVFAVLCSFKSAYQVKHQRFKCLPGETPAFTITPSPQYQKCGLVS
jgi:hypothetical protein